MRECKTCGKIFIEGYLFEETSETFCSIECLEFEHPNDSKDLVNDGDVFWTAWVDDFARISEILQKTLSNKQKEKFKNEVGHIEKRALNYGPFSRKKVEFLKSGLSKEQKDKTEVLFEVLEENYKKD